MGCGCIESEKEEERQNILKKKQQTVVKRNSQHIKTDKSSFQRTPTPLFIRSCKQSKTYQTSSRKQSKAKKWVKNVKKISIDTSNISVTAQNSQQSRNMKTESDEKKLSSTKRETPLSFIKSPQSNDESNQKIQKFKRSDFLKKDIQKQTLKKIDQKKAVSYNKQSVKQGNDDIVISNNTQPVTPQSTTRNTATERDSVLQFAFSQTPGENPSRKNSNDTITTVTSKNSNRRRRRKKKLRKKKSKKGRKSNHNHFSAFSQKGGMF